MSDKLPLGTPNLAEERLEALRQLLPEAFSEGKLDLEKLKLLLGQKVETGRERYGLSWAGKSEAVQAVQMPSTATLRPMRPESVDFDSSENVIIEGDNLEALKLLQKAYHGKVKMIYIDPPYNTGNDFVYPDNFRDSTRNYLQFTGQVSEEGVKLTTNGENGGRFHSKWLSMMYPRLQLAKALLRDDGVIFVSIDDNEVHSLRQIMNEIFGEENFVAQITVLCNPKGRSQDKYFATNHEHIVGYSKTPLPKGSFAIEKDELQIEQEYPEEDELGKYRLLELRNTHREFGRHNRKNLFYPFFVDNDGNIFLEQSNGFIEVLPLWDDGYEGCWTWEKKKSSNDIDFLTAKKVGERWKIYRKSYASGAEKMLKTIWVNKDYFTERGQKVFNTLFSTRSKLFQSPKSPFLLTQLMETSLERDDLVLDFFAGSGTTAQSVLEMNLQDKGKRKFILVQLPEKTDNSEFPTITHITRARVSKVIEKIKAGLNGSLDLEGVAQMDLGFRAFKLDSSNFKVWDGSSEDIQGQLEALVNNLVEGRSQEDVLFEMLLKSGLMLSSRVSEIEVNGQKVYSVEEGKLLICLDRPIQAQTLRGMMELNPEQVLALDVSFEGNDALKTNTVLEMRDKGILFRTI